MMSASAIAQAMRERKKKLDKPDPIDAMVDAGHAEGEKMATNVPDDDEAIKLAHGGDVLDANARKHIAAKNFAGPDRSYPIEDEAHARNALARVAQHGSSELQAEVRRKVHEKYPSIGEEKAMGGEIEPVDPEKEEKKAKAKKILARMGR